MGLQGANGQGKTSILEAIYLLSRCRSFRTPRLAECAGWGRRAFGGACHLQREREEVHLKFEWSIAGRQLSLDGRDGVPLTEFWGHFPAVAVSNGDRELVRGSGSNRRNWMDGLIAFRDPAYLELAQRANLLHRQKNAILKQDFVDRSLWTALTGQLRVVSQAMMEKRQAMADRLGERIESAYRELTGMEEHIGFSANRETERRLAKSDDDLWDLEERSRHNEMGPHREDWDLSLESKSLRHFGSEGQQKSAALAMRLAEIGFLEVPGVILIDDALIELDGARRERFWSQIPEKDQVFYASTDTAKDEPFARLDTRFEVRPGRANSGDC